MDFVSTSLVTLAQPSGFWVSILNAFRNGTGSYIMAVILIALIVRVVFALVDIINKRVNMKNMEINAKMKPELDAIQKKYGYDQRVLQQKTSEVYKKYQFSMLSSCLPMLVMLVLNFTVFLTLWNSLQTVSNFNIAEKYENIKTLYVNVIALNENEEVVQALEGFEEGDKLIVELSKDDQKNQVMKLIKQDSENNKSDIATVAYNKDLTVSDEEKTANEKVMDLLQKYVIVEEPETPQEPESTQGQATELSKVNQIIKASAEKTVEDFYLETQEGFLWIKNIYRPESPSSPLFTKKDIEKYLSQYYTKAEKAVEKEQKLEGKIFGYVVAGIDRDKLGVNGYYILTIIAVGSSLLSLWLSNLLLRKKGAPKQKQPIAMYIIMPVIFGIFTFMYTSLFAIYLIVGQLVNMALTPLTTLIVKKWAAHSETKQKDKNVIEVDYRRK